MIPGVVVDVPVKFPQACALCMGQQGPMFDKHREMPGGVHVYVCEGCIAEAAKLMGLVRGEKLTEIRRDARLAGELRSEIETLSTAHEADVAEIGELTSKLEKRDEQLSVAYGRIQQLEGRIAEAAKRDLELVGVPRSSDTLIPG